MYRIIIADDEEIIRKGIIRKIDWNSLGFIVVGEAANGKEALELAQTSVPDLILADIRMPIMNGIELARIINDQMPLVKIVFCTGHEEFEYAQQSVRLGVLDYILKPFSSKELSDLLVKIKVVLDNEVNENRQTELLKKQLMQNMPLLRERFLNDLLFSAMEKEEIEEKQKFYNINIKGENIAILIIEIDDYKAITNQYDEQEKQLLKFTLFSIVNDMASHYENMTVFEARYDNITVLYCSDEVPGNMQENINQFSTDLQRYIQKHMKISISIGVSRIGENTVKLRDAFTEAIFALEYKYLIGNNAVIFNQDVRADDSFHYGYFSETEKQFLTCIKLNQKKDIPELIESIFYKLSYPISVPKEQALVIFNQLITSVVKLLHESGIEIAEFFVKQNPYSEISTLGNKQEIKEWLKSMAFRACDAIVKTRDNRLKNVVDKAKLFITNNYSNNTLSLKSVAAHVNMSESYLSAVFKSILGDTFQNYLINLRLEKAKELLRSTDMYAYEIAEMVGYSNVHYFGMAFKKNIGITPSEYREIGKT